MTPFWVTYLTMLAFFFGACVGSFLNVCIYRIPRDESVVAPRSHCPKCDAMIAWYDNIPFVSWLALKARCRHCGAPISPRYFLVELLTSVLFLAVWNKYGFYAEKPHYELVPIFWLVISGLILGTFVDFEHMILPDRVTIGGMIAGVALSLLVPSLQNAHSAQISFMRSLIGLAVGFGSLFAVAEVGKIIFGRKRIVLEAPVELSFSAAENDERTMKLGDEDWAWDELFPRASDKWKLECPAAKLGDRTWNNVVVELRESGLNIGGEKFPAEQLAAFTASVNAYRYPREAMGFGDVKLMGAIGAFFGWPAIFFTVLLSSILGSMVGIYLIVAKKYEWQSRIPYGPYIALACVVWILGGREWWLDYWFWLTGAR